MDCKRFIKTYLQKDFSKVRVLFTDGIVYTSNVLTKKYNIFIHRFKNEFRTL